jgi:hypothetical protein
MVVAADLKLDSDAGKAMKNGMVSKVFVIFKLQGMLHW